jgi:hypothetical protein
MKSFTIQGTEFGIDESRSSWEISEVGGARELTIELRGDGESFKRVRAVGTDWDWALYPPHLYLRSVPVPPAGPDGTTMRAIVESDLDDYDIGLYFMEHCDLFDAELAITKTSLYLRGQVALFGPPTPIQITWSPDGRTR